LFSDSEVTNLPSDSKMSFGFVQDGSDTQKAIETCAVIALWLATNISIAIVMKWVYEYGKICIGGQFPCQSYEFPLAITTLHMVFSWFFSYIYIFLLRRSPPKKEIYGWQRLQKIGPLAACFAGSVALGNLSLVYIFPSFNQMVASASPLITFVMAIAFTGAKHNLVIWLAMIPICGGMIICAENEANYSLVGTILVLASTLLRAAKSIIQGELLSSPEDKLDSATLLYYMSPYAAIMMLVSSLVMEGVAPITLLVQGAGFSVYGMAAGTGSRTVMMVVVLSGVNAFFLNLSTFLVTAYTSAVMLQVLGNVKSCFGIAISVVIFGNALSMLQGVGVFVTLLGVWIYQRESAKLKACSACPKAGPKNATQETSSPEVPIYSGKSEKDGIYASCA